MKLVIKESLDVKNVYDLLSEKTQNAFVEEAKLGNVEGDGANICVQLILPCPHQRVDECDGSKNQDCERCYESR
jgi:hypothetical protein